MDDTIIFIKLAQTLNFTHKNLKGFKRVSCQVLT